MRKISYLFGIALLALTVSSCGGSKTVSALPGEVEVFVPCSGVDFQSDKNYFRATTNAVSTDMGLAKTKALADARAELATSMNAIIERTTDNYASSYQVGEEEEAKKKYNDLSRTIVKEKISNTKIVCEKIMKMADGKYRCYIAVEAPAQDILNSMHNKIKADDKLRLDFEYEKYKKTFEEEMSKIE